MEYYRGYCDSSPASLVQRTGAAGPPRDASDADAKAQADRERHLRMLEQMARGAHSGSCQVSGRLTAAGWAEGGEAVWSGAEWRPEWVHALGPPPRHLRWGIPGESRGTHSGVPLTLHACFTYASHMLPRLNRHPSLWHKEHAREQRSL